MECESEKKEGLKDDFYIFGMNNWVFGGLVVLLLNWGSLGEKCVGRGRSV